VPESVVSTLDAAEADSGQRVCGRNLGAERA